MPTTTIGVTINASADISGSCSTITQARPKRVSTSRASTVISRLSVPLADDEMNAWRAMNSVEWRTL